MSGPGTSPSALGGLSDADLAAALKRPLAPSYRVGRQPFLRTTRGGGITPADLAIVASPRLFAEGTAATLWASVQPGVYPARRVRTRTQQVKHVHPPFHANTHNRGIAQ